MLSNFSLRDIKRRQKKKKRSNRRLERGRGWLMGQKAERKESQMSNKDQRGTRAWQAGLALVEVMATRQ